ncbi:outer membrane protein assembly factor BamE [Undibacterium terreum]|uniref:outer membrane protein assembly factor BamE n=1 Tax=Undibacterium terreum TaxID=1224302 RepID=UPI001E539DE8|nr:outer membrane protein assembly factor BamE [Undibacterium terreum]
MRLLFSETSRSKALGAGLVAAFVPVLLSLSGCASKAQVMETTPLNGVSTTQGTSNSDSAKSDSITSMQPLTPASAQGIASGAQVTAPTGIYKILNYVSPYRITIQQGNFVSQEMIAQLKEGMTREQVRFLLGTALLTDMFHEDRWDYPFRIQKPNGEVITSRVTVFFKNNTVNRFEGGNLPTEKDYLAHITNAKIGERTEIAPPTDGKKKNNPGE